MSKRIGVLFSGGLDSTYLVYKNLKEGNIVYPIYIEIENNRDKTILEKNRIELMYKEFANDFPDYMRYINYVMKTNVNAREDSIYLKQVPVWIMGLLFSQGIDVDEIQIGYVCGDDSTSYVQDMKDIYYSYEKISRKLIHIDFPLLKTKKWEIIRELHEKYHKYIFSCESPYIDDGSEKDEFIEYNACCECTACKTIIISDYYETNNFPREYEKGLKKFYFNKVRKLGFKMVHEISDEEYDPWKIKSPFPKEGIQLEFDFQYSDMEKPMGKLMYLDYEYDSPVKAKV